jgi:carbamoyltransferase
MTAGLGGVTRHGCVALADGSRVLGVCEQERVTRTRSAGFNRTGLPDEALDVILQRLGRSRGAVGRFVLAETYDGPAHAMEVEWVDHHFAHACAAYLSSPFQSAAIVVCDHEMPKVSVWQGTGSTVSRVEWAWDGPGFADIYSRCARAFGFLHGSGDQRLEALARLQPDSPANGLGHLIGMEDDRLAVDQALERTIEERLTGEADSGSATRARLAAAFQSHIGQLFLKLLNRVRQVTGSDTLCLAGSFFYHSSMNTLARSAGIFREVFVPIDPGNAGLAVGTALYATQAAPRVLSPFMGPAYSVQEIKEVLDNCKLQYSWELEEDVLDLAVRALQRGRLVGWFDGAMEWGPRALGARCILANPMAPYVLENLNRFLKRREPWRGYALSGPEEAVTVHFDGPGSAPFMECDYRPREPEAFRNVLPRPGAAIRVQTVGQSAPSRFRRLLDTFSRVSGVPFLVNTSFNGFHEPIVCSPRDAVRVFYGSGLDLLVMDRFVLAK